jgi:hypothetical protein
VIVVIMYTWVRKKTRLDIAAKKRTISLLWLAAVNLVGSSSPVTIVNGNPP